MADRGLSRVEHGQQLFGELSLRALGELGALARRALLEVVELGVDALERLEVLVALSRQIGATDGAVDERLLVRRRFTFGYRLTFEDLVVGEGFVSIERAVRRMVLGDNPRSWSCA